jgi:hypothetical protein
MTGVCCCTAPGVYIPPMVIFKGVKVKLPLYLTKHYAMKTYWRNGGIASCILLTSVLEGGEWSASRPGRFAPKERAPGTHWIGGWVGSRAVLDAVVKRKISIRAGNRILEPRSFSP